MEEISLSDQHRMTFEEGVLFRQNRREERRRRREREFEEYEYSCCQYEYESFDEFEGMSDYEIESMSFDSSDEIDYRLMSRTDGIFKVCRGGAEGRDYVDADEYGMHYCFRASRSEVREMVKLFCLNGSSSIIELSHAQLSDFKNHDISSFIEIEKKKVQEEADKIEEFQAIRFKPPSAGSTNIYLMIDGHTGYIKIGRSKNPSTRERTLQAQIPLLRMLWTCSGINADETKLHSIFKDKRLRGEWFDLGESDVEYIKSMEWRKQK